MYEKKFIAYWKGYFISICSEKKLNNPVFLPKNTFDYEICYFIYSSAVNDCDINLIRGNVLTNIDDILRDRFLWFDCPKEKQVLLAPARNLWEIRLQIWVRNKLPLACLFGARWLRDQWEVYIWEDLCTQYELEWGGPHAWNNR